MGATPKWTAYHYNAIAKEIREAFPLDDKRASTRLPKSTARAYLTLLALSLAKRFDKDNPRFNPVRFLNACSPNVDIYPLGELWDGEFDSKS